MQVDRNKLIGELEKVCEWQAVTLDQQTVNHLLALCKRSLHVILEPQRDVRSLLADSLRHLAQKIDDGNAVAGIPKT